jgi:hypothetical protein
MIVTMIGLFPIMGRWSILAGTVGVFIFWGIFSIAYGWMALSGWLPIRMQYPIYLHWKEQLERYHEQNPIHPLIDFPLATFIEFKLDEEYEKAGIPGATAALKNWFNDREKSGNETSRKLKINES